MGLRLLVSGGGTGGHIYPALAIASGVRARDPAAEVLFAGTADGMEHDLARRAGLPFAAVPSRGLIGKSPVDRLRAVGTAGVGLAAALGVVRRFRPHVVVGTGGYASGPVVLAAVLTRVPALIQEQNVFAGVTNRLLAPFVAAVAVPHEAALAHLPRRSRGWVVGNPVRPELLGLDRERARETLGVPTGARMVLVTCGSRGSATVNRALADALPVLLREPGLRLHWVTGRAHFSEARARAGGSLGVRINEVTQENLVMEPYLDRMGDALAACDLVVCRAGAVTLAEVAAVGRASLLIPSPYVTYRHQDWNARPFEAAGAARVLDEQRLTGQVLAEEILALVRAPERLGRMAEAARGLAKPDALEDLVDGVLALARGHLPKGLART